MQGARLCRPDQPQHFAFFHPLRLVQRTQPRSGPPPLRGRRRISAEFLQCRAARDRLGQALGEFIGLVVHTFLFVWLFVLFSNSDVQGLMTEPTTGSYETVRSRRSKACSLPSNPRMEKDGLSPPPP